MADQKKRGFHAFEDRVHQIEEEDAKQSEAGSKGQGKEPGAERGAPPAGQESQKPRK